MNTTPITPIGLREVLFGAAPISPKKARSALFRKHYRSGYAPSGLSDHLIGVKKEIIMPRTTAPNKRTGLGVWTVSQVALELSRNESGQPVIESFERNLPRVLEALIKIEDTILKHYGSIANGGEN
jgi:hypothetical protein